MKRGALLALVVLSAAVLLLSATAEQGAPGMATLIKARSRFRSGSGSGVGAVATVGAKGRTRYGAASVRLTLSA